MNALFNTFVKLAEAQQLQSRDEFVRCESRVIAQKVTAEAVLSDAAINRSRRLLEQLEREIEALEHYERNVYGRAPK